MRIEGGREVDAGTGRKRHFPSPRVVLVGLGAALAGLAIAWADTRPGWDDTGITVGAIVLCAALGALGGLRAWLSATLIVLPLLAAELPGGTAVLVSIPLAALGAFGGGLLRSSLGSPGPEAGGG